MTNKVILHCGLERLHLRKGFKRTAERPMDNPPDVRLVYAHTESNRGHYRLHNNTLRMALYNSTTEPRCNAAGGTHHYASIRPLQLNSVAVTLSKPCMLKQSQTFTNMQQLQFEAYKLQAVPSCKVYMHLQPVSRHSAVFEWGQPHNHVMLPSGLIPRCHGSHAYSRG